MNNALALLGLITSGSEYGYDLKHNYDQYFNILHGLTLSGYTYNM